jgi:hypothetical protein
MTYVAYKLTSQKRIVLKLISAKFMQSVTMIEGKTG